jgi:hypothetical protein
MPSVLAVTTAVDCIAVLALAWLVLRCRRAYELAVAEQRAALERLRGELADLVADAERRAAGLDETLAAREASLRALVAAADRADRRAARPGLAPRGHTGGDAPRSVLDPAEVRLRRDLELTLGTAGGDR